ncbi:MAG: hypothetical protein AB7O97_07185 [Planctomycetota bacterium]
MSRSVARAAIRRPLPFARLAAPAATVALLAAAPAQTLDEGYHSTVTALPAAAHSVAVVDAGTVWFDGTDLVLQPEGQPARTLLQFPTPRFGAFTLPLPDGALLFAESSLDEVWLVSLDAAIAPRLLTTVAFPYDAAPLGTGRVVVSARTGGFPSVVNDLVAVDLVTGAQVPLGAVPGASGPVVVDAQGNLLCATAPLAFPPPAGTVEVLRWSPLQWTAALGGGAPLDRANAQLLRGGLDTAGDLALDRDGDLLVVDWLANQVLELDDLAPGVGGPPRVLVDHAGTGLSPTMLALRPGVDPLAPFEPFALPGGETLLVLETDFATTTRLRAVRSQAAGLDHTPAATVPAGPFALALDDAPRSGVALLALSHLATGFGVPLQLPGFEQVVRWDTGMLQPLLTFLVPLDAQGHVAIGLTNPGFPGGFDLMVQAVFVGAGAPVLGATAVRRVPLGP